MALTLAPIDYNIKYAKSLQMTSKWVDKLFIASFLSTKPITVCRVRNSMHQITHWQTNMLLLFRHLIQAKQETVQSIPKFTNFKMTNSHSKF